MVEVALSFRALLYRLYFSWKGARINCRWLAAGKTVEKGPKYGRGWARSQGLSHDKKVRLPHYPPSSPLTFQHIRLPPVPPSLLLKTAPPQLPSFKSYQRLQYDCKPGACRIGSNPATAAAAAGFNPDFFY